MNAATARAGAPEDWRVERKDEVDSTNDEARRRALAGDGGRLWIVARSQTKGRGRRGRDWSSPPGNLYASALLIDPCPAAFSAQIGFVAGVAVARAARDCGAAGVGLKWPNDLVADGAKLAGLLVEGLSLGAQRRACIVGIGVNCASSPAGLAYPTTHISVLVCRALAPEEVFAALVRRFAQALEEWRAGENFAQIRRSWLDLAAGLGGRARVEDAKGAREGIFAGLDPSGRMMFRGPLGLETIEAADVTYDPAPQRANSVAHAP